MARHEGADTRKSVVWKNRDEKICWEFKEIVKTRAKQIMYYMYLHLLLLLKIILTAFRYSDRETKRI